MSSLRAKILLLGLLPICTLTVVVIATTRVAGRDAVIEHAQADLKAGHSLYVAANRSRVRNIRKAMRKAANQPPFNMPIRQGDGAVDAALDALRKQIGAEFAWLVTREGVPVSNAKLDESDRQQIAGLVELVVEDEISRGAFSRGERSFEMLTVPVRAGSMPLWLTVGIAIDADFVATLKKRTGTDVTAVGLEGPAPRLLASTLPELADARSGTPIALPDEDSSRATILRIGSHEYVSRERSLLPGSDQLRMLLQVPIERNMAPFNVIVRATVALAALAIALVAIGATTINNSLRQAIARMVEATREIRAGNYEHPIPRSRVPEIAVLAESLQAMQVGIAGASENMAYQARFDSLTGLPNRFLAMEKLAAAVEQARKQKSMTSLMLIDLDRFSDIGASFGHDIGEALLVQASDRLRATLDAQHTLARLEGNEFAAILPGTDIDEATEIAEELLRLLGAGLAASEINICVEASVGISACPTHGDDPEQLMLRAAVAVNDARERSGGIAVYEDGKEQHYARQLAILGDLRNAVRQDQLKLYLQPKILLADGTVCGAEALTRWDHPTLGFLSPDDFIGIAERSGNISLVTRWALENAVSECRLWLEEGLDLPISVNLSVRDLADPDLPVFVRETLRDHDLDPRYLTVEITEQALLQDFDLASGVLQCLRDLGIRISIDDFGTGHSSLAKLKHLPIDEVKIDQSFVVELPDNRKDVAIVRATIELAHNLGIEVLAEGIENRPAMSWLTEQGCERGQGFLISRPMPAETFSQWVSHFSNVETQITRIFLRPQNV